MGINTSVAALLTRAREEGTSFAATATIGRQSLTVPNAELVALARRLGVADPDWSSFAPDGYSEDFFRLFFGAQTVTSFDASPYQNVGVVHDFNQPLPACHHGSCDVVFDGGSMEHIFDVRQVLSNYMLLPKVGGSVFISTTANNLCGHGFYQFSVEFFYRVFCAANGYEIEKVCLIETPFHGVERSGQQKVYLAADPPTVGKRTVIVTDKPVSIYVHARRVADVPLFATPPHQSDYASRWDTFAADAGTGDGKPSEAEAPARDAAGFTYISAWDAWWRSRLQRRKNSLRNRKWFTPLVP